MLKTSITNNQSVGGTSMSDGPWGFPARQEPWEYDPNKPLWSGKDEKGNPAYYKKQGNDFYKYWKTFRGQNGGGVTTRHRQKVDTDFIDPHTGQSRQQFGIPDNESQFQQYFGDYLRSLPNTSIDRQSNQGESVMLKKSTTGVPWKDSYAPEKSANNIRQMMTGREMNPYQAGLTPRNKSN